MGQQPDETPPVDRLEVGRVGAADRDLARAPRPAPLQRPQQRGLARAVAAHHRGDPAARQGQRHVADRHGPAVHHRESPDHHVRRLGGRCGLARRCQRERAGAAPGVADAQRQRAPPGGPGELDQGRYDGRGGEHLGRVTDLQPSLGSDQTDPVRERDHPLQPVLGEQHRDADVVDQAGERGEHVLGGGRVECGGRLVEHDEPGVHGQHRADRDPLLLPAGQGAQVARAQVCDAEQVEGLLDPAAHRLRQQSELLHAVGELLLDRVGDEPGQWVLPHEPDGVRPLPRRCLQHRRPVQQHLAGEVAAGEPRHEPGHDPEQGGLARPGRTGDEHQLALLDGQVDAGEDRRVGVRQRDPAQLEEAHAVTIRGSGAATAGSRPEQHADQRDQRHLRERREARVGDDELVARHPPGDQSAVAMPESITTNSGQRHGSGR